MDRRQAETIALQAVAFVVGDEALRARFLSVSGCTPADLRARTTDPELLAGLLAFLVGHEADLNRFAEAAGLSAASPRQAILALGGHWPE
ncbi:MAG: DUF3572 family protein [Alphaproteobacteria bacterium]|nr:DUF3572 family protein [Alphaproteobacteria bacterium]